MNYTNLRSLEVTYGEDEVDGLVPDTVNLTKAAAEAKGEIDTYLHSAGYALPLVFTEMTGNTPSTLPGALQKTSDAFTAFHLASSEDLHKAKYDTDRAEGFKYLDSLLSAKLRLVYPDGTAVARRDPPDGHGMVVVSARAQVFTRSLRSEEQIFPLLPGVD